MKGAPSQRGWDILSILIKERARKAGPDGDLPDEGRAEELQAAADSARRLLKDRGYMAVRLQAMEGIAADFALWLSLDPAHPNYQRELLGLHMKSAPRFWELFWPEELIKQDADARRKASKGDDDGGDLSGKHRRNRR